MSEGLGQGDPVGIETFASPPGLTPRLDLQPLWLLIPDSGGQHWRGADDRRRSASASDTALTHPWGARHRPDWAERGLIIWPRGGLWWQLRLHCPCPDAWRALGPGDARARLVLRWWADRMLLLADGRPVHGGDLFDTSCRWPLPATWWQGQPLQLLLRLRSPLHDDGALIHSRLELEPTDPRDPHGLLKPERQALRQLRLQHRARTTGADTADSANAAGLDAPGAGRIHLLGHAHLDLAWLWPVADTWQAAERTFQSVLALMERHPQLHFGHSTPALYAWLEQQRPELYGRIRAAMQAGRWEPLNGPWVETDCVLTSTASLLRQFQLGQQHSHSRFPEWEHQLAWLPDSFGFSAGLPAVAAATGVRWFCTHKLAWNASNPFPHRLFRWRSRCGAELLALMTAPIGSDGDPVAIERYRLAWQAASGVDDILWLPGMGDHGGGPTAEMLEQLALWQQQPVAAPQQHGSLRRYLAALEPLAATLPVWRDELYLELHRGCPTSRPDQKRHNRTLERLLREAELARALLLAQGSGAAPLRPAAARTRPAVAEQPCDWRTLLFQQFHDILPGTSIPEVFEQAEPQWRQARRRARQQRDLALQQGLGPASGSPDGPRRRKEREESWWVVSLQPHAASHRCLRLPAGRWRLGSGPLRGRLLQGQAAAEGGIWLQLPLEAGVSALALERQLPGATPQQPGPPAAAPQTTPLQHPLELQPEAGGRWRIGNGLLSVRCGPAGVEQLFGSAGQPLLAAPLRWCRWRDQGEFWDAWDLAADHRDHPLPWSWETPWRWHSRGPLCCELVRRGRCGRSPLRLSLRLLAGCPWLELVLSVDWQQRHELLQLEVPLAQPIHRWAADTGGGVIERPAQAANPREQARWEVAALSWIAGAQLAVLLDGPQGVSASAERLGVSLLRAPTWPDPGADNGRQRLRLALLPASGGWRAAGVPDLARRLREPLWRRPAGGGAECGSAAETGGGAAWPGFPPLAADLRLVGLRPALDGSMGGAEPAGAGAASDLILTLQNEGPCRRRLELSPPWQVVERLDGLERPAAGPAGDPLRINPWQLAFWRLRRAANQAAGA